jgi:hypothetical protein
MSEGELLFLEREQVESESLNHKDESASSKRHGKAYNWCRKHKRDVVIAMVVGLVVGVVLAIPAAFLVDPIREALRTKPLAFVSKPDDVTFKSAEFIGFADPRGLENLMWKFAWDVASSSILSFSSPLKPLSEPSSLTLVVDLLQPGVEYAYQVVIQDADSTIPPTKSELMAFSTNAKPNGTLTVGGCWTTSNVSTLCTQLPDGVGQFNGWLGTPDGKHAFYITAPSSEGCTIWKVDDNQAFSCVATFSTQGLQYATNKFLYVYNTGKLNSYPISSNGDIGNGNLNIAPFWNIIPFTFAISSDDKRIVLFNASGVNVTIGYREDVTGDFVFSKSGTLFPFYSDIFTVKASIFAVSDSAIYGFVPLASGFRLGVWNSSNLNLLQCFATEFSPLFQECVLLPIVIVPFAPIIGTTGSIAQNAVMVVKGFYLFISQLFQVGPPVQLFPVSFLFNIGPGGLISATKDLCYTSYAGTTCKVLPGEFNSKWLLSPDAKSFYAIGTTAFVGMIVPVAGPAIVQGIVYDNGQVDTVPPPFGCVGTLSSKPNSPLCNQTFPAGAEALMTYLYYESQPDIMVLVTEKVVYYQNMWFRRE